METNEVIKSALPISNLFGHIVLESKRSRRTERGDFTERMLERINADRDGIKYKKLSIARAAHLLSIYSVPELYSLEQKCLQAKNYSKCWWFFVLNKPDNKPFN